MGHAGFGCFRVAAGLALSGGALAPWKLNRTLRFVCDCFGPEPRNTNLTVGLDLVVSVRATKLPPGMGRCEVALDRKTP